MPKLQSLKFDDAIKNPSAARCTCVLSADETDLTLQIVKERQRSKIAQHSTHSGAVLCEQTLVEVNGIEPMTPCLQSRCSPS